MVDVGGDHQHVGADLRGEQRGREVLVDDGLDAVQRAVGVADDRDAAAAGADDHVAAVGERPDGGRVEHLERLGRRDDAAPAPVAAVLPGLAVLDEGARLVLREVAADRLGGRREARVVAVHQCPGHDGRRTPVDPAVGERLVEGVEDQEADGGLGLGTAPVERHRWDDVRGQLVLHQQVADLRAVAVGEDHLDAGGDQVGHPLHRDTDRVVLVLRGGAPARPGHGVAAESDENPHAATLVRRSPPARNPNHQHPAG